VDGHRPPHADVTFGPTVPPECPFVAPVRTPTNVPTVAWGRSRGRCRGHRITSFRVMSGKRRRFGRVRRLPSGRFQVRYSVGEGQPRQAPATFATKDEAERYLAKVEVDLRRGTWFDADAGDILLEVYAPRWLVERPVELQPRTVEIYTTLLRQHIYPTFGATALNRISLASVRTWHASLRQQGIGQVTVAKACRLLKDLSTAVEDDLIPRNPCRLKAAGVERSAERKPPSLAEVELKDAGRLHLRKFIRRYVVADAVDSPAGQLLAAGKLWPQLEGHDNRALQQNMAGCPDGVSRVRRRLDVGNVSGRVLRSGGHPAVVGCRPGAPKIASPRGQRLRCHHQRQELLGTWVLHNCEECAHGSQHSTMALRLGLRNRRLGFARYQRRAPRVPIGERLQCRPR